MPNIRHWNSNQNKVDTNYLNKSNLACFHLISILFCLQIHFQKLLQTNKKNNSSWMAHNFLRSYPAFTIQLLIYSFCYTSFVMQLLLYSFCYTAFVIQLLLYSFCYTAFAIQLFIQLYYLYSNVEYILILIHFVSLLTETAQAKSKNCFTKAITQQFSIFDIFQINLFLPTEFQR